MLFAIHRLKIDGGAIWAVMEIFVNGTTRQVREGCRITDLIEDMALTGKRIAVEVNLGIVPRSQHTTHLLHPGDRVEIVHAIGGGEPPAGTCACWPLPGAL